MQLIRTNRLLDQEFQSNGRDFFIERFSDRISEHVILSHTWYKKGENEEMDSLSAETISGAFKGAYVRAQGQGFDYIWDDTCRR
jgi:hypothetical protein